MPRKPRWYDAIPEATTVVDCGGEHHRVTWRRGRMVLEAHDLTAERTMLAFGGGLCPCMRVLEVWVEQFRMSPDLFGQMHTWLGENAFLLPTELALPRRMGMVLCWERSWRFESWLPTRQAKLLADEVSQRALPLLRQHLNAWKARTGARVVSGQVEVIPSLRPAALTGNTNSVVMKATAFLPPRWVVDVWARGIAVVDDAFVLALTDVAALDDVGVVAGRWEPAGSGSWVAATAPARVRRDVAGGREWSLTWEPTP